MTRTLCTLAFAAGILLSPGLLFGQTKLDPPVKPTVSGTYMGDGKPANIQFVFAEEHEPFSDKEAVTLIFTEKDPKGSKKPSFDAMFNKLGSALILNVFQADGDVFGCQVAHTGHAKSGFSSIGKIKVLDFKFAGGNISGRVSTGGVLDAFGQTWQVDLSFAAPLPEKLRAKLAAPPAAKPAPAADTAQSAQPAKPAGPQPLASQIPLPADAKEVQFKPSVNQIQCASALPAGAVAKELSGKLKAQGWKESAGGIMTPNNAILKREKDGGKLTIMVQPAGAGSTVKIFTEGMDWTGVENTPANPAPTPAGFGDFETDAQKLLQDALKALPGR